MPPHSPAQARARRPAVLGAAVLSLVAAVGFVLAPVERPDAVYGWPSAPGDASAVAVPLMLGRPAELTASGSCADVRDADPDTVLLSTTPLEDAPGLPPQAGLRATVADDGTLRVRTAGTDLAPVDVAGDCTWEVVTSASATTLSVDGEVRDERAADLRPQVAGVFTGLDDPGGVAVDVTADTVFQTSPTVLKTALGVVAVLALLAALVLVARSRPRAPDPAGTGGATAVAPRRRGRVVRWLVDAGVVLSLAWWTVAGPMTVDDGYIAGIVRSREANGYVGNVFRWWNAPEAPFGWFYEVVELWARVDGSTVWLRVPSLLLGVLTWFLVGRLLLPRLGAFAARGPWVYAVAALAFLLWWLPSNAGLRPEAWVAAGFAAVLVLLERGLARRSVLPLLLGLVVAGATLALTPTGAVAFLPYLAAAVPVLRVCRDSGWGLPAVLTLGAAAAASALLFMFADQNLAAVSLANEFRADLPGSVPWYTEIDRYDALLSDDGFQGSLARRVPVLLTLLAAAGVLWHRTSGRLRDDASTGVDAAVALRLTATLGLSLVLLLFTPTKWTMHFGALVPVGAALLVVAVHLFSRAPAEPARPGVRQRLALRTVTERAVALTAVLLVAAVCWAGPNSWAYLSDLDVPWNQVGPELRGVTAWAVFLTGAAVAAVVGAVAVVRARVRGEDDVRLPFWRWVPSAGAVVVVVALLTVGLELTSFLKSTWDRRDTYTLAADARATLDGRPCGLAEDLTVETDPTAGLLTPAPGDADADDLDGFTAVDDGAAPASPALVMAGEPLPGWAATGHSAADGTGPAELTTGWFELPASVRDDGLPLVVTISGDLGAGTGLALEWGTGSGDDVAFVGGTGLTDPGGAPAARDVRLDVAAVPADAGFVRLRASDGGADGDVPLAVSAPRVPVTEAFADVVDPDVPALVDWPVAFVFPCQTLAVQRDGVTDVPGWRISPPLPGDAGDIAVAGFVGGPYTAARTLVDQVEVPVYQDARPLDRPVTLFAWEPRVDVTEPRRDVTEEAVAGWTP